jgi:uncharacterized cofD-like protein
VSGDIHQPSVVVVGGGHGCSRSLAALGRIAVERTAIVTVADDGGSSGRLRRDHDVVALGDLRMALLALADAAGDTDKRTIVSLARRRFVRGELAGHSLGNLLLLGLIEEHEGDLLAALDTFGRLAGARGQVLPSTTVPVTLVAETALGTVAGQAAVATTRRILSVRLQPTAPPVTQGVAEALERATLVLLGPGSLYTSVLPVLLVPGVAEALVTTRARVVLVGNLREQPGETEGMDLADHAEALLQHVPGLRLDVVLAHERARDRERDPGARTPLAVDEPRLRRLVGSVMRSDLGDELDGHDPERLARAIARLIAEPRPSDAAPVPR